MQRSIVAERIFKKETGLTLFEPAPMGRRGYIEGRPVEELQKIS